VKLDTHIHLVMKYELMDLYLHPPILHGTVLIKHWLRLRGVVLSQAQGKLYLCLLHASYI